MGPCPVSTVFRHVRSTQKEQYEQPHRVTNMFLHWCNYKPPERVAFGRAIGELATRVEDADRVTEEAMQICLKLPQRAVAKGNS